ncbi:MAG: xanthine dehydrogenase FAD-binding subunit XdhB [Candidatus Adiutrix sp.]|jgi:xanthine dehydrogenase FAD-binding subunit|nr:xanthine dehydrogenase FAD-binding subunit XdhB [Candidatus Adiutrix sp.]
MFDLRELRRARSVAEAVQLLADHPEARLIAGGTDVLVKLRHFDGQFRHLVDIHNLPEIKFARLEGDRLMVGAGLTFAETIDSPLVKEYIPVLGEACATVAGPQIRNMGTVGGNIANGAVSADTAAPMLVLEPELLVSGPEGRRHLSIHGFHTGPGQVALKRGEVLFGFSFDLKKLAGLGACYYKYAMRSAMDIATIGCAAGVKMEGGVIKEARLALTVAAPTPIRCPGAEAAALGRPLNDETMKNILAALEGDIKPRTSWRATREFRVRIIKALAERMMRAAAERAAGRVQP